MLGKYLGANPVLKHVLVRNFPERNHGKIIGLGLSGCANFSGLVIIHENDN